LHGDQNSHQNLYLHTHIDPDDDLYFDFLIYLYIHCFGHTHEIFDRYLYVDVLRYSFSYEYGFDYPDLVLYEDSIGYAHRYGFAFADFNSFPDADIHCDPDLHLDRDFDRNIESHGYGHGRGGLVRSGSLSQPRDGTGTGPGMGRPSTTGRLVDDQGLHALFQDGIGREIPGRSGGSGRLPIALGRQMGKGTGQRPLLHPSDHTPRPFDGEVVDPSIS
jgi:hypothetical protein